MEKVLIINPPSPFLLDEKVFPNLAPLFVATTMLRDGYNVEILDLSGKRNFKDEVEKKVFDYDVFAFTGTSSQLPFNLEILEVIKTKNPSSFTVIGGPHASVVSSLRRKIKSQLGKIEDLEDKLSKYDPNFSPLEKFDLIISGEGEVAYKEIFRGGEKWREGGIVHDLNSFPIPDRGLINFENYHYEIDGLKATSIITQRGCPFTCYFCSGRDTDIYRKVRLDGFLRVNSPERVLEEMDYLHENFGIEAFMWYDDEINLHNEKIKDLTKLLQKRPYKHRGFIKSELFVRWPEQAELLKKAGFVELCTGAESGSNEILKKFVRKHTTRETNKEAVKLAQKNGMRFKAFTIIGHPYEKYEDVMLTKDWILEAHPDNFDVTIHQPYPGAPAYDNAVKNNQIEGYEWAYEGGLFFNKTDYSKHTTFYKGVPGEYVSTVRTPSLSAKEIVKLREEIDFELREKFGLRQNKRMDEVSYGGQTKK